LRFRAEEDRVCLELETAGRSWDWVCLRFKVTAGWICLGTELTFQASFCLYLELGERLGLD